jgi:hypothetical protein
MPVLTQVKKETRTLIVLEVRVFPVREVIGYASWNII